MKASIIIRTRNEEKDIKECLEKIYDQDFDFDFEVILVDTESTDDTLKIASQFGVKVISITQEEFSYPLSLNIGIPFAKGEIIVFISGHAVPIDNLWLRNLVNALEEKNVVAVSGPHLVRPDCRNDAFLMYYQKGISAEPSFYNKDNQFLSNTNSAYKKYILEKFLFDKDILDIEEKYWANNLLRNNTDLMIKYIPEAAVYHSHLTSTKGLFKLHYNVGKWYLKTYQPEKFILNYFSLIKTITKYIIANYHFYINDIQHYGIKWIILIPYFHFIKQIAFFLGYKQSVKIRD